MTDYVTDLKKILDNAEIILKNEIENYSMDCENRKNLFLYQQYIDCFENINSEKKYVLFGYDNPNDSEKDIINGLYTANMDTFKEMLDKELNKVVELYMSTSSISLGEALIFAEKHFANEVGFLNTFIMGLTVNIILCRKLCELENK